MNKLDEFDLRRIASQAKPDPELPVASQWIDQINCVICYCYKKDSMVLHRDCLRFFCADCALRSVERGLCHFCNQQVKQLDSETGLTRFCTPSPNDHWLMDNLVYLCKDCLQHMDYHAACTHPNCCPKRATNFQPPSYIHNWNEINILRRQTVSNPIKGPEEVRRDRLLIYHHNGRQLDSKFVNASWDIPRVKQQIGRLTDSDATEIRLFKFYHEELDNDALVKNIANKQGATHITSLTDIPRLDDLDQSTAIISFHDIGPRPIVARPYTPRTTRVRGRTQF